MDRPTTKSSEPQIAIREIPIIFKSAIFLMYGIITFTGITGNAFIIYVIFRRRNILNITSIFIVNLAFSNLLMSLIPTTATPIFFLTVTNKNSEFVGSMNETIYPTCFLLHLSMGTPIIVSIYTCAAIALHRYFIIIHPHFPRISKFVCVLITLLIWIASIFICLIGALNQTKTKDGFCTEGWSKEDKVKIERFYSVAHFIATFVIPSLTVLYCYFKICIFLRSRYRYKYLDQHKMENKTIYEIIELGCETENRIQDDLKPYKSKNNREKIELMRKKRTNKMLVLIVSIFFILWLPYQSLFVCDLLNVNLTSLQHNVLFLICHWLAMSSTIYNPIIYAWCNEGFRTECYVIIPKFSKRFFNNSTSRNRVKWHHSDTKRRVENEKISVSNSLENKL